MSPASRLHGKVPGPVSVTQGMQRTGLGLGPLAMAGQQQLADAFAALDRQETGVVLPQDLVQVRPVREGLLYTQGQGSIIFILPLQPSHAKACSAGVHTSSHVEHSAGCQGRRQCSQECMYCRSASDWDFR